MTVAGGSIIAENLVTVDYEELQAEWQMSYTKGRASAATRMLKCAYADRQLLKDQLTERGSSFYPGFEGGWIGPARHPLNLLTQVADVQITRQGWNETTDDYEYAVLRVSYETPNYHIADRGDSTSVYNIENRIASENATLDYPEKPTVEYEFSTTAEFLTLPYANFAWDDADTKPLTPEDAPGYLVQSTSMTLHWQNLTTYPALAVTATGLVNSVALTMRSVNDLAIETLLYVGPHVRSTVTAAGHKKIALTLNFIYRQTGWNKFMNPHTGAWSSIYVIGGAAYSPYLSTDLTTLWALAPA